MPRAKKAKRRKGERLYCSWYRQIIRRLLDALDRMRYRKKYTLPQLSYYLEECYTRRWHVGKDYFQGARALLEVLKRMELQDTGKVGDVLDGIDKDSPEYPL